jgi:hypothetical protein
MLKIVDGGQPTMVHHHLKSDSHFHVEDIAILGVLWGLVRDYGRAESMSVGLFLARGA